MSEEKITTVSGCYSGSVLMGMTHCKFRKIHRIFAEELPNLLANIKELAEEIKSTFKSKQLKDQRYMMEFKVLEAIVVIQTVKDKIRHLNIPNEATTFLRTLLQDHLHEFFSMLKGFRAEQVEILTKQLREQTKRSVVLELSIEEREKVIKDIENNMEELHREIEEMLNNGEPLDTMADDDDSRKIMEIFDLVFEGRQKGAINIQSILIENYADCSRRSVP